MRPSWRWRRIRERLLSLAGTALVVGVFLLALLSLGTYGTVQHTARSEFCNSCHIMEPYYESWQASSHKDVACIECHYEPGALETFEGKFKALSQLAKYVTRTAGTKPWAEVSDQSCMRSGCHSVRMLEGPVEFGRVKFDHRHHLLESRRGRRLRCVSCHSQIVQGEHITVTDSVCFACHFMPGADGERPESLGDCLLCHGPPADPVEVAGASFDHAEYVARGVGCTECHDPVIQGRGAVGRERCHSCHSEVGHIQRIRETPFIHQIHVTDHKVECFECHDEIRHGLLPLEAPEPSDADGCGACHVNPHDGPRLVYAGTGAAGVEDQPSRMYQTRVTCRACHTGRTGFQAVGERSKAPAETAEDAPGFGGAHAFGPRSRVASAGEADCIHCHGTGFDGMLGGWQAVVGAQIDRLRPLLEEIAPRVPHAEGDALGELFLEAQRNLELIAVDGSRGAHNPSYALSALRASAERLDRLFAELDPARGVSATEGFPFVSAHGCSTCHLDAERLEVEVHARPFSHQRHLRQEGIDCSTCHTVDVHGAPSFPRQECASCHHREDAPFDSSECGTCHAAQAGMLAGALLGFEGEGDPMADLGCSGCHGEPPDIFRPKPALCVLCHEPGYDAMQGQWQSRTAELEAQLRSALVESAGEARAEAREGARRALEAVSRDGSLGVHNPKFAHGLLEQALQRLAER
jgi:nitrate/TMAO reductase-like tetraheme cytochrome c subunit